MVTVDGNAVEFRFFRPGVQSVHLAGDFNGWDPGALAMEPEGNGWWRLRVRVRDGFYEFRYVADGHAWYTDYAAYGVRIHPLGINSILRVEPVERRDRDDAAGGMDSRRRSLMRPRRKEDVKVAPVVEATTAQ